MNSMNSVARVVWEGGSVSVPIDTPYDRELLVDHVKRATAMHGGVRLYMCSREWVMSDTDASQGACSVCRRAVDTVPSALGEQVALCIDCAAAGADAAPIVHGPRKLARRKMRKMGDYT